MFIRVYDSSSLCYHRVPREIQDQLAPRQLLDQRERKDLLDHLVLMEVMAPRDTLDHPDLPDLLEMVLRVQSSTEAGMTPTTFRRSKRWADCLCVDTASTSIMCT